MYGRFFGLLALGNTIDGGQTRADENGTLGAVRFGVQMRTDTGHLPETRQKCHICVSTLFGTSYDYYTKLLNVDYITDQTRF